MSDSFAAPWTVACYASLSFTISWALLKFMFIESVMLSNHLILCLPLLLLPSIFPSMRVSSNEVALYEVAKLLELKLEHQSFPWVFGVDSFRVDWISLLPKGLARVFFSSTIQKHQLFNPQPSLWSTSHIHTWRTTGKTIALTIWTFVSKVMALLFNTLSRFVTAFLPKSKH